MALFDFTKKKEPEQQQPQPPMDVAPPTSLVDQIIAMQQQGYTDNMIIQALQRAGYPPAEISDAMAQVQAKQGMEPFPGMQSAPQEQSFTPPTEGTEELVEKIVDEKWQSYQKELGKYGDWQQKAETRMDRIEQVVQDLKSDVENLHKAIVAKIGDYDRNLLDVGTEIKAMEKVFSKVLPELTDNVAELGRMSKAMKAKK